MASIATQLPKCQIHLPEHVALIPKIEPFTNAACLLAANDSLSRDKHFRPGTGSTGSSDVRTISPPTDTSTTRRPLVPARTSCIEFSMPCSQLYPP